MVEEDNNDEYYEEGTAAKDEFVPVPRASSSVGDERHPISKTPNNTRIEHGTVFNMPLTELRKRHVQSVKECYIVLFEKFMIYKIVADYEMNEEDEITGAEKWKPYKANYRWTRMRDNIVDVNMYYDNSEKLYGVGISFLGASDTSWFFEKGKDAKLMYEILQNYLVTRDQKE